MSEEPKKSIGEEIGKALVVIIPAITTMVIGYISGKNADPTPIQPTPIVLPTAGPDGRSLDEYVLDNAKLNLRVRGLEGQINLLRSQPSQDPLQQDALDNILSNAYITTGNIDVKSAGSLASCADKISSYFDTRKINYIRLGAGLFRIPDPKLATYAICTSDGDVSFFVMGQDEKASEARYKAFGQTLVSAFNS